MFNLKASEIPNTNENARLLARDLESGDERGLAKGCCLAYLMTGHEAYLIRARCYADRSETPVDLDTLMAEMGVKVARWAA
jgi:hypothetical protein